MKRLLLFLLLLASLDCFSQEKLPFDSSWHGVSTTDTPKGLAGFTVEMITMHIDTVASHLLVSHTPPGFAHSIEGYCITRNRWCTGKHLVYRSRRRWIFGRRRWFYIPVDDGYDVWSCRRKEGGL